MMHQYIGARYVPIFYVNSQNPNSSEWENNVEYEPLVWVSLPNGNMYLSKKTVPASVGSPASNPNYWMAAGQFNAYIQSLQDQINDMQDGTVPGSLQDQINDNASDITALQKKYDNYLLIGDSYLNGVGTSNPEGWGSHFKEIRNIPNDKYFRFASNGAGLVATGSGGKTFNDVVDDAIAAMTSDEKSNVGYVIILGGYNDANYNSLYEDMMNAKITLLNKLLNNFPNADYYIGVVGKDIEYTLNGANARTRLRGRVIPAYSNVTRANVKQFTYLPNLNLALSTSLMANNNHPSDDGNKQIARALDCAMRGEYRQGINNGSFSAYPFGNADLLEAAFYIDDRICTFDLLQGTYYTPSTSTLTLNGDIDLGEYSAELFPSTRNEIVIPIHCLVQNIGQNKTHFTSAELVLKYDKHVYLRLRLLNGVVWEVLDPSSRITIYPTTAYIPSSLML